MPGVMYQVSTKDAAGNLYNVKSEYDDADVAWAMFGAALENIGAGLAVKQLNNFRPLLDIDPLATATGVAQAALPVASVQAPPIYQAAGQQEQWGVPPVPPMQPSHQQPAQQPYYQGGPTPAQLYPSQQADPLVNHVAPAAPAAAAPSCQHGVKKFISKPAANGKKAWSAWGCPAPKGDPSACGLDFIRS